ncbi:hypothetical protein BXT92_13220 [Klebsiella pneumoniae]|nr:hypothetical protein BXT92_13220 [Klebsiella pneumoniae]
MMADRPFYFVVLFLTYREKKKIARAKAFFSRAMSGRVRIITLFPRFIVMNLKLRRTRAL